MAVETLRSLAFEPLDHNGLGAQFLRLKGIGWGTSPPIGLTTVGAPFEVIFPGRQTAPATTAVGRDAVAAVGT